MVQALLEKESVETAGVDTVSLSLAERSYVPAISMLKQYVTAHLPAGRVKEWAFQPLILLHPQTFNRPSPNLPPPNN